MHRHTKPYKGDRAIKRFLRRADKRRVKRALCRIEPDEYRAYRAPAYDRWNWD